MNKFLLYIMITIMTVYALDGININFLFKKGKILQARLAYFLILLSIIYLVTNFVYDFIYLKIF